jgi:hypothetical protein
METVGVEPTSASLQARCSLRLSYIPERVRTGGVEPPQREATGLQPAELAGAQRPHEGGRPDSNRRRRGSQPRVLPSTPRPPWSGDDRDRTGGLSPDKRALCSSELRPREWSWKAGSAPRNRRQRRCRHIGSGARLLPIGTPASACLRRHPLTGWPWRLVEASCTLRPALCTSRCSVTSLAGPSTGHS